jgi:hypothetical protein
MLAGLLLGFGFVALDVHGASADTPGAATVSGPVGNSADAPSVAAVPDDSATLTSYYATSPYYNPYYNYYYYNYYYPNNYYNSYYYNQYPYYYYNSYYPYYYNYHYYPNYYYYGGSSGSYTYCTVPGGGSVWVAYGQSTVGLICN